jgi:hypothetical protein
MCSTPSTIRGVGGTTGSLVSGFVATGTGLVATGGTGGVAIGGFVATATDAAVCANPRFART